MFGSYRSEKNVQKLQLQLRRVKEKIKKYKAIRDDIEQKEQKSDIFFPLLDLPPEISLYILFFLEPKCLITLFTVNRIVRSIALDHTLWKQALYKDFSENFYPVSMQIQGNYFSLYKKALADWHSFNKKYKDFATHEVLWAPLLMIFKGNTQQLAATLSDKLGDFEKLYREAFVKKGDFKSLLMYVAIECGRVEVIHLLISLGFDIKKKPELSFDPLSSIQLTHDDDTLANWFDVVIRLGNINIAQLFHGFLKDDVTTPAQVDWLVRAAIRSEKTDVFEFIINNFSFRILEDNLIVEQWLWLAARRRNFDIFQFIYTLIEYDFLCHFKPDEVIGGFTIIHAAIEGGNIEIVKSLMSSLDSEEAKENNWLREVMPSWINGLHTYAIQKKCHEVADYLIDERQAKPSPKLLLQAIEGGRNFNANNLEYVIQYLKYDLNARDMQGQTPLDYARHHNMAAIGYLIKNGATDDNVRRNQVLVEELMKRLAVFENNEKTTPENELRKAVNLSKFINYINLNLSVPLAEIITNILNIENNGIASSIVDPSMQKVFMQLNNPNKGKYSQGILTFKRKYSEEMEIIINHLKVNKHDHAVLTRLKNALDAKQESNYVYPLHKNNKKN